jgi:hypothetical protein
MLPVAKAALPTQTNYNIPSRSWKVDANLSVVRARVSWEKQEEERQS